MHRGGLKVKFKLSTFHAMIRNKHKKQIIADSRWAKCAESECD